MKITPWLLRLFITTRNEEPRKLDGGSASAAAKAAETAVLLALRNAPRKFQRPHERCELPAEALRVDM